jgi:hypothetical protein
VTHLELIGTSQLTLKVSFNWFTIKPLEFLSSETVLRIVILTDLLYELWEQVISVLSFCFVTTCTSLNHIIIWHQYMHALFFILKMGMKIWCYFLPARQCKKICTQQFGFSLYSSKVGTNKQGSLPHTPTLDKKCLYTISPYVAQLPVFREQLIYPKLHIKLWWYSNINNIQIKIHLRDLSFTT